MILTYKKKTAKRIGLENSDRPEDERNTIVNEIMAELKSMVQGYEKLEDDSKHEYYFMGESNDDIPVFLSKHKSFVEKLITVVGYQKDDEFELTEPEDREQNWFFRATNYIMALISPTYTTYDPITKITKKCFTKYVPTLESYKEQAWEEIRSFEKQLKVSLGLIPEQNDWFITKAPESLPELQVLTKLTEGASPILREWYGGKYKCRSLECFIKQYQKLSDNLTPALIRDYLISDRTGKPYTENTIEQRIKEHRT